MRLCVASQISPSIYWTDPAFKEMFFDQSQRMCIMLLFVFCVCVFVVLYF